MTSNISDLMRKKLVTIEESGSVQESANRMKDKNVSSLIVVDANDRPLGLSTSVFMMSPQVK
jgi:predicted transcriptional regulator